MEKKKAHLVNENHKYEQGQDSNCNIGNYSSNTNKQTIKRKNMPYYFSQQAREAQSNR